MTVDSVCPLRLGGFKRIPLALRQSQGPDVSAPLPCVGQGGPHLPFPSVPTLFSPLRAVLGFSPLMPPVLSVTVDSCSALALLGRHAEQPPKGASL